MANRQKFAGVGLNREEEVRRVRREEELTARRRRWRRRARRRRWKRRARRVRREGEEEMMNGKQCKQWWQ